MTRWCILSLAVLVCAPSFAQNVPEVTIARVQYGGGGDWYADEQSLPELLAFARQETLLDLAPREDVVELSSDKLFTYPYLYLTGHGNVDFSETEARRLRRYLDGEPVRARPLSPVAGAAGSYGSTSIPRSSSAYIAA